MRWLCALVFALAAGSSALAAAGLAVPPHVDPPGTPRIHDHLLAAYRYPLFLLRLKMLSRHAEGPAWTLELPGRAELDALVLATLALLVPRLPRPTRRAIAVLAAIRIAPPEWRAWLPLAPPRPALLAFA
ncbi:MAG: hypothetical protein QOH08_1022 [Chloroflexota bacterium]|jgi:hypothetical protein|nr:hypothetical protein [Chloroflexota bacterium]